MSTILEYDQWSANDQFVGVVPGSATPDQLRVMTSPPDAPRKRNGVIQRGIEWYEPERRRLVRRLEFDDGFQQLE